MLLRFLFVCVVFVCKTEQLLHGRAAKLGEFPYVVRIQINDHIPNEQEDLIKFDDDVSAGVLITTSRVLTTCDSVGFFAGHKVHLFNLDEVTVLAGSVTMFQDQGQIQTPSRSNVHPNCYLLSAIKTVLFNYGMYEFDKPFGIKMIPGTKIPLIAPIKNSYESKDDMEHSFFNLNSEDVECFAAGWGNDHIRFQGIGMPDLFQRFSKELQIAPVKIVDYPECYDSTCNDFDECWLNIWELGYVCVKAEAGGPCNEDKGAPLICMSHVFGMHVHAKDCMDTPTPRLFLRVDLAFNYVFNIKNRSDQNSTMCYAVIITLLVVHLIIHSEV